MHHNLIEEVFDIVCKRTNENHQETITDEMSH